MRADVQLSTKFLTTQNAHQVGLLVTVGAEAPVNRPPINVALVLDRSGSMAGEPIEAAKQAAIRFSRYLGPTDQLSVVVFDDRVLSIYGPHAGGDSSAEAAIQLVVPGGSTNLSGGWLKGRQLVQSGLVNGTNRVVLLTDGQANQGVTDEKQLAGLAGGAMEQRVTTTCIGFGPGFNEDLLKAMSQAGGGNAWYVEHTDQMAGIFDEEIEGLVALAAQNLEIEVRLTDPRVQGVTFLQDYPVRSTPDGGWQVVVGDLLATSPRSLGLIFHVDDVQQLGEVTLGEVRVSADHLLADGIEHRVVTMPVVANLDRTDHVQPTIERTLIRFQAARARVEAVQAADAGRFEQAADLMRGAADQLERACPEAAEEIEDLRAEAERLGQSKYEMQDRKYHMARSEAVSKARTSYADKLSRRRR